MHLYFVVLLPCSSIFATAETKEQRAFVKFCFLLEKTAPETVVMLETAYKDTAMNEINSQLVFLLKAHGNLSVMKYIKWDQRC